MGGAFSQEPWRREPDRSSSRRPTRASAERQFKWGGEGKGKTAAPFFKHEGRGKRREKSCTAHHCHLAARETERYTLRKKTHLFYHSPERRPADRGCGSYVECCRGAEKAKKRPERPGGIFLRTKTVPSSRPGSFATAAGSPRPEVPAPGRENRQLRHPIGAFWACAPELNDVVPGSGPGILWALRTYPVPLTVISGYCHRVAWRSHTPTGGTCRGPLFIALLPTPACEYTRSLPSQLSLL